MVGNTGSVTLSPSSWLTLDFGIEVGGLVALNIDTVDDTSSVSLAFTESPVYVNPLASDDSSYSTPDINYDGVFTISGPLSKGHWSQPSYSLRGGFRYLTIASNSNSTLELSNISCAIAFMPHVDDLKTYTGYFYAPDPVFHDPDFLTQAPSMSQANSQITTWPSDMAVSVPTQLTLLLPSTNPNQTLITLGISPERLSTVWTDNTHAVAFLEGKVDSTALMNATSPRDWGRINAEGNAILYKVLLTASDLANYMGEEFLSAAWGANATALKAKYNGAFWVGKCENDANSFAVLYNLILRDDQKVAVSKGLEKNWNDLGPVVPELPDTISPCISGFEVQAHFEAGQDNRALDLSRREWGYMLYTNLYQSSRGYNYDPSYTSHAHGWWSGPTSALTFYILGLTITSSRGATWSMNPHINGGLPGAEGGFETSLGWFGVRWALQNNQFFVAVDTPEGTDGLVKLSRAGSVVVDEVAIDVGKDRWYKSVVPIGSEIVIRSNKSIYRVKTHPNIAANTLAEPSSSLEAELKLPVEEAEADPAEDPDVPVEDPMTEPEALAPDEIADPVLEEKSGQKRPPDIVGAVLVAVALALVNEDVAAATEKSPDCAKTSLMLEMFTSWIVKPSLYQAKSVMRYGQHRERYRKGLCRPLLRSAISGQTKTKAYAPGWKLRQRQSYRLKLNGERIGVAGGRGPCYCDFSCRGDSSVWVVDGKRMDERKDEKGDEGQHGGRGLGGRATENDKAIIFEQFTTWRRGAALASTAPSRFHGLTYLGR
ncbi:Six-hairpin glycosidase-like protein [Armillaria fumosa]|nr:Six-hairpin glycosidase-like protein [Armillaria fumosa]